MMYMECSNCFITFSYLYADRLLRGPVAAFLTLAVVGGIAFYVLIYVVRPLPSIERFVLHLAPLVVLAAARVTAADANHHPKPVSAARCLP